MRGGSTRVTIPRREVESTRGWPGWMEEVSVAVTVRRGERLMILTGWLGQFRVGRES